jgi:hypothetical protein
MGWHWLEGKAFDDAFKNFVDEEAREKEMDRREPLIKNIAERLSAINKENEQEGWRRQARYEDGDDYADHYDPTEDMEDTEREAYLAQLAVTKKVKAAQEAAEVETLEEELATLGARMARPYEHWNEEEGLMAYLERDR